MPSDGSEKESAEERVAKLKAEAAEEKDKQNVTHKELREHLEESVGSALERLETSLSFKASLAVSLEGLRSGLRDEFNKSLPDFGILKGQVTDLKEQVHGSGSPLSATRRGAVEVADVLRWPRHPSAARRP